MKATETYFHWDQNTITYLGKLENIEMAKIAIKNILIEKIVV